MTAGRLLLVVAAFCAVLACAVLCGKLLPHGPTEFDQSITTWMVTHRAPGWTTLAHILSTVGSQVVLAPLTVIAAALLIRERRYVTAGWVVVAWGGAILLYTLTKLSVHRPRPPMQIWLTDVGRSTSFPSGHATQSTATLVALAVIAAAWRSKLTYPARVLALVIALGVGCSRVYLGVHWTTDVLAGWLIGAAWVAIVLGAARLARRRGDATTP